MTFAGKRVVLLVLALVGAYFGASYWAGTYEPPVETRRSHQSAAAYVGTINGFEFFDPNREQPGMLRGCTQANALEPTAQELAEAPLDFRVDDLPAGAQELSFSGLSCAGEVVTVVRAYSLPDNGEMEIARVDAPRRLPAVAAKAELIQFTLGGRRGIANQGLPPNRREELYLEADPGYLYISAVNLRHEELLKIAASVVNVR